MRLDVGVGGVGVWVGVTVVVDDLHVECTGTFGKGGTDTTHADDSENFSFRIVGRLESRLPLALTSIDLGTVVLTQAREDEEHSGVGSGIIDSSGGVRDSDSTSLGCMNIDLIVSRAVVADRLERRGESVDELSVEKANLVDRVVVSVNGNDVGIFAAGRACLEELGSGRRVQVLLSLSNFLRKSGEGSAR